MLSRFVDSSKRRRYIVLIIIFVIYSLFTKFGIGSSNVDTRYATMESLVERGTFIIDDSSFIETWDKVLINNHFYSDKPPFLALAGVPLYFILFHMGISFESHPGLASYILSLLIVASTTLIMLFFFYKSLLLLKLKERYQHMLVLSLGLATLILPYSLVFNNHTTTASLGFIMFYLMLKSKNHELENRELFYMGLLAGLIFGIDYVAGGAYILGLGLFFLFNLKKLRIRVAYAAIGGIIPLILVFWLLYSISGSFVPFPIQSEYFIYEGSKFDESNLSGVSGHDSLGALLFYAFHSLAGYRGLFSYTPLLLIPMFFLVSICMDRHHAFFKQALVSATVIFVTICYYIVNSTNYGGHAYGMRWFVAFTPLLFFFTAFYFKGIVSKKKLKWFYIVGGISLFLSLIGVYNPWADPTGYPFFNGQPVPFLNNFRFMIEDVLNIIAPSFLETLREIL